MRADAHHMHLGMVPLLTELVQAGCLLYYTLRPIYYGVWLLTRPQRVMLGVPANHYNDHYHNHYPLP
jgi:hypothetical protein